LRFADAQFYNFPLGKCTVVARHPALNLAEAEQEVDLSEREILEVRYIYLEAERQLLRVQISSFNMDE
jgi:hypothetical protein